MSTYKEQSWDVHVESDACKKIVTTTSPSSIHPFFCARTIPPAGNLSLGSVLLLNTTYAGSLQSKLIWGGCSIIGLELLWIIILMWDQVFLFFVFNGVFRAKKLCICHAPKLGCLQASLDVSEHDWFNFRLRLIKRSPNSSPNRCS